MKMDTDARDVCICVRVCVYICVRACTFLLMSRSSFWRCEALSSCWWVRNLLRDASVSRSSFTFSSLFIAPSLPGGHTVHQPPLEA